MALTWIAAGVATIGLLATVPFVRRWWLDRARIDPRRDPLLGRVRADRERALEALLDPAAPPAEAEVVDRAEVVVRGLAICRLDDVFSWRGGLRRLLPLVERLADDDEGGALRAETWLQLGEIGRARSAVSRVRADHWRACAVRAALYELDGDVERAESAWVAALLLAPADRRDLPGRRLEALRRRYGRRPTATQELWDRPR